MAISTDVPIATYTVTGSNLLGTTGVTFTIPAGYTDIKIVQNVTTTAAAIGCIRVGNGSVDTGANYSRTSLSGDGTTASSARSTNATAITTQVAHETSTIGTYITHIMNYSNTNMYKTFLNRNNNTAFGVEAAAGVWRSNLAIDTVTLFLDRAEYYVVGSTFNIYGIGSSAANKATGGAIYSDDLYNYHVFTSTGTFTPSQALTADVLVVAGGGGGSSYRGGGGGAGGVLYFASQSLTSGTGYTCTVGAGGAGGVDSGGGSSYGNLGTNGGDSQFGALTLVKGGGAGGAPISGNTGTTGSNGGSGGGGAANVSSGAAGGSATSGQGNAGGAGLWANTYYAAGGGGGAGAAGTAANGSNGGGVGGVGIFTYSSWGVATGVGQNVSGTYYIAGGGAGGAYSGIAAGNLVAGGLGGGGSAPAFAQNQILNGGAGMVSTGGGGAGTISTDPTHGNGGNGGSGVVIVRYLK